MKYLKRFESHEESMSREQMCDILCNCGYTIEELESCSDYELSDMCKTCNMDSALENLKEQNNYMFFGNLETMKDMIDKLLQMDKSKIDSVLNDHDWASDHISVANENLEQVYNFLKNNINNELIGGPKIQGPEVKKVKPYQIKIKSD